ncbi:MAG: hypothetical protein M0Z70_12540, partial [Nitrospiraceae bacterium]|nr:hypothetical protein [Nitrospiraceae bacterium]
MLRQLRPSDSITALFSFLLLLLTALFYAKIPSALYLILIYSSLIFFQLILFYLSRLNSFLALTRDIIFPFISVLIIFDSLGLIVHNINPHDIDYLLIRLDYIIFGGYPTIFMERLMDSVLTDVLQVAYSTYYFLPIILGVVLKIKKKNEEFEKTLFLILL